MQLFLPITKVDAKRRLVYGTLAEEVPDKAGEIFDYASSRPNFERWSAEIARNSDGRSRGNLRAMHGHVAAGKLTDLAFDDEARRIEACAKVVDDAEWAKVLEGVYTGFSIGGKYARRWTDERDPELTRYTAEPAEVSLVDNPCIPSATFAMIKEDGTCELRKFKGMANGDPAEGASTASGRVTGRAPQQIWTCGIAAHAHLAKAEALACIARQEATAIAKGASQDGAGGAEDGSRDKPAKREDGKDFPASDYAYVPDPARPSTWKLRLTSTPGGDPDPRIVGAAAAALGAGFRGNPVDLPEADRARVVARARAAWLLAHPDQGEAGLPAPLKPAGAKTTNSETLQKGERAMASPVETSAQRDPGAPSPKGLEPYAERCDLGAREATEPFAKVGARHSKADMERVPLLHDTAVSLGARCAGAAEGGKVMGAELAKLHAALARAGEERDALSKRVAELEPRLAALSARLERVEAQPLPPKGALKVVDKKGDNLAEAAGAVEAPLDASSTQRQAKDPLALVKQAQKHPKPLFAMIGGG